MTQRNFTRWVVYYHTRACYMSYPDWQRRQDWMIGFRRDVMGLDDAQ